MGAETPTLTNNCFKRLTNTEALWVYLRMEHTPIHGNLNGEKINLAAAWFNKGYLVVGLLAEFLTE